MNTGLQRFHGLFPGGWRCEGVSSRGVVKGGCGRKSHEYWASAFSRLFSVVGVVKGCRQEVS